ncbi:MAG: hypothetical protein A2Y89_05730 [Chloroflexi bacterium RBG_13_51_18]|nr:MAG: hypothetical protein A2Y89_05730 [Chloroflexi bacterium RBG_13_51_18]
MYTDLYSEFLDSDDTLQIYRDETLIFSSDKDRLLPLMEYLAENTPGQESVTIFDKIMGNAAALLAIKANCREVYSPLGSELAIKTLEKYNIEYHLTEIVPYIMRPDGKGMCPMEKLSIGKEPEEFYREMKTRIEANK